MRLERIYWKHRGPTWPVTKSQKLCKTDQASFWGHCSFHKEGCHGRPFPKRLRFELRRPGLDGRVGKRQCTLIIRLMFRNHGLSVMAIRGSCLCLYENLSPMAGINCDSLEGIWYRFDNVVWWRLRISCKSKEWKENEKYHHSLDLFNLSFPKIGKW